MLVNLTCLSTAPSLKPPSIHITMESSSASCNDNNVSPQLQMQPTESNTTNDLHQTESIEQSSVSMQQHQQTDQQPASNSVQQLQRNQSENIPNNNNENASTNNLRPMALTILNSPTLARVERASLKLEATTKQLQDRQSFNDSCLSYMHSLSCDNSLERSILDTRVRILICVI